MDGVRFMIKKSLLLVIFLNSLFCFDDYNVSSIGNYREIYKNNFNSKIADPLEGKANFTTLDNSQSFSANITCNKSKPFIQISYNGDSDIDITIKINSNLDNNYDKTYTFNNISGLGTNGVIKCDLNSWNNCKHYIFEINNDNLILTKTNNVESGFCINSSCNYIAKYNKKYILDVIGGAISTIYQNYYKNYVITSKDSDSNNLTIYAQNINCKNTDNKKLPAYSETATISVDNPQDYPSYEIVTNTTTNSDNNDFTNEVNDIGKTEVSVNDNNNFNFTYSVKNKNGKWIVSNDSFSVDLNFSNPNVKYCEVEFLIDNTQNFSDNTTPYTTKANKNQVKTKIKECTGSDYSICPLEDGESIKHNCGEIDNFAEVTASLKSLENMSKDFVCSH